MNYFEHAAEAGNANALAYLGKVCIAVVYLLKCTNEPVPHVTVTGKHGSNYRLSLSCNRKSKKLNLTNLFNSQQ